MGTTTMKTYARITAGGAVAEVIATAGDITQMFPAAMQWIDCTATPGVGYGWSYADGAFSLPTVPAPTLAQQAAVLLSGTLEVASTGTPALDGSYAIDVTTQSHISAEMLCVQVTGKFADGTTSIAWQDVGGVVHTFPSTASFQSFALAVAGFVAAAYKVINGASTTLPTASVTIQ
jgi:hypothetical protein